LYLAAIVVWLEGESHFQMQVLAQVYPGSRRNWLKGRAILCVLSLRPNRQAHILRLRRRFPGWFVRLESLTGWMMSSLSMFPQFLLGIIQRAALIALEGI
jgi:hypothetical protein